MRASRGRGETVKGGGYAGRAVCKLSKSDYLCSRVFGAIRFRDSYEFSRELKV